MTYERETKKGTEVIDFKTKTRTLPDGRKIKLSSRAIIKMEKSMVEEALKSPAHNCLWDGVSLGGTMYKETIKYNGKKYARYID